MSDSIRDGSEQDRDALDAARYRWLREHIDDDADHRLMEHKKGIDYGMKTGLRLDAAIDAAILKERTK